MDKSLSEIFIEFVKRMAYFEKKFHIYGVKEPLYSSEIHILSVIGNSENIYGMEIARRLGVTKSAASQMLIKLERKGLISKQVSEDKQTKYIYFLTAEGEKVYDFHENLHEDFNTIFEGLIKQYSKDNAEFLEDFFKKLDSALCEYENKWEKVEIK